MGLFQDMRDRGLWESYSKYVVAMEPLLETAARRGMPVSVHRHAVLSRYLLMRQKRLLREIQSLVPDAVRTLKVCKRKPSYRLPFKPSNQALIRYMRVKGQPVPRHFKTQKETTQQDELQRLARSTGDPIYRLVLDYRDAVTIRNNHLHNWQPGADGRVHPTFYHTATGQLEARRPNTMNAPHHKDSGKLFRSIVEARPGHRLLSFDYKGFHALYLAWESGDKDFERLVRMDVHSYLTAHFLRLPGAEEALGWPDDHLRDWLSAIKRQHRAVRDAKVKHALLGYNNGMGYRKLYQQNRDFFDHEGEAKRLLELMDALFPRAAQFRTRIQEQAHEQGYLVSKFGCIRYFWEVKRWKGGTWSHGDDAEAAVSFIQQNHAHCHLKDVMLRLDAAGWLDAAQFVTPIHDDLTFECPNPMWEEAVAYIQQQMEAPNATTNLSVGVEVKTGQRWNQMEVLP